MSDANEDIEEIIDELFEEESTIEENDSKTSQKANLTKVGKKPVPPTKKETMHEDGEEEEEEELAAEETAVNASKRGAGKGKLAGLYKDGTGKGAVVPEPVATDASDSSSKLSANVKAKKSMREDIETHMDAMFDGEELTEDFKTKASTIFEAALQERIDVIESELQEEYQNRLVSEVDEIKKGLTEQLDSYLSYVVEEWMEENRLVVEKGIRTEIAEEFMQGLRNLFLEHDISVPETKVDLTDQLAETVESLKTKLDEEMNNNIELKSQIAVYRREQILDEAASDLADTQKERFAVLAEGITFETEEDLRRKAQIIKESYFSSKKPVLREEALATSDEGSIDEVATPATDTLSESMASYAQTLSRLNRR
jgi:hypothetical protein